MAPEASSHPNVDKVRAAEFSFFLAMPTMLGAFVYDLYKSHNEITASVGVSIAIGFVVSFIVGVLVVRYLLDFVGKHGFAPFAWYRIAFGIGVLVTAHMGWVEWAH